MATLVGERQGLCMPEPDLARLAEFEISAAGTISKLLAELVRKRALIWLFVSDEDNTAAASQLIAVEDGRLAFSLQTDHDSRNAFLAARRCTVVGFLDSVKVQFEMRLSGPDDVPEASLLFGEAPARLYRIQRRAAFRVRPPAGHRGNLIVRGTPGHEDSFRIFDLSATGLSFLRPREARSFELGDRIALARLELGPRVPVPCSFVIRSILDLANDPLHDRVGCEFINLPNEVERAIAIYVQDAERAQLRARTDR